MTFSPREQVDILKAWLALTLMFVFVVHRGFTFNPQIIGKYFFVIGLGFVLHELAHKLVAQRYGFWAEFRSDDRLLMMSLAMAYLTGFFFAAPGAVWWHGPASQKEAGMISLAGPVTNIAIAFMCLGVISLAGTLPPALLDLLRLSFQINAFLAFFNLLPIFVLDGAKIIKIYPIAWGVCIATAGFLAFLI